MIWNYIRSAIRNLLRQRVYAGVNIAGLAIGMASSLALLFWVLDEIGYDKFHDNADRIQRVCRSRISNGELLHDGLSAAPVGPTLKDRFPGVEGYCCTYRDRMTLTYDNESRIAVGLYVDPSFLDMFSFPVEKGDPGVVLEAPNSIVLTQETATGIFGSADPIGKQLDNGLVVTGIVEEAPENSSLQFDFLVTNKYLVQTGDMTPDAWYSFGYETFVLLKDRADVAEVAASIKHLYRETDPEASLELHLQPLVDIHLKNLGGGGRIVYVYTFSLVAALLLIVACINFVNLATARATQRTREIAVRKAVGASRWQLGIQIMLEQLMQTTLAMLLAVCLLEFTLPLLTEFFGKDMALTWSFQTVTVLAAVTLATGLAAGIYPALILSSFRPSVSLRSRGSGLSRGSVGFLRKALVVFQFAVSAGLIVSALIINEQMNFIQNKDLGINRDNIVCLSTDGLSEDYRAFEKELAVQPGIEKASAVFNPPAWSGCSITDFDFDGKADDQSVSASLSFIDYNYVDVFGLEILEGRNLSEEFSTDATAACLINESAAHAMGLDRPVGRNVDLDEGHQRQIVGVVRDFHFASLRDEVEPLILVMDNKWYRSLSIKLEDEDIAGGLASVEQTFNRMRPGADFNYSFFDEYLNREYRIEARTKDIALAFTAITTIIAVLGLLGLAANSVERRTKEIGIRKTLGASSTSIVRLVTREFMILILAGNIIIAPIAYHLVSRWLENFAYRVDPGWSAFALAAFITVAGAWLAMSFKALQAARTNPVNALKYE